MNLGQVEKLEAKVEALRARLDRYWWSRLGRYWWCYLALTVSVLVAAVALLALAIGLLFRKCLAPPLPDVPQFRGLEIMDERGQVRRMMAPDSGELSLMSLSGARQ